MNDRIPLPTPQEREAAIRRIAVQGLAPRQPLWRRLSLEVLFFGVRDSLILGGLLFLLGFVLAAVTARLLANSGGSHYPPGDPLAPFNGLPPEGLAPLVVLTAPLLYGALQGLTTWQERLQGTLEWKRSCLITPELLLALRTAVFGGAAAGVCVPMNYLFWRLMGEQGSLFWMLGASYACLFLYAAGTLFLGQGSLALPALWLLFGVVLARWRLAALLLLSTPALLCFLIAAVALGLFLARLHRILSAAQKGGHLDGTVC